ncbi:hypothetical protein GOP80_03490 [Planococcaceae bacterium Storch 2/2-2]|nr:hypothetical protein [Planococcaceae bacterium Storch 2/2-2]
MSDFIKLNEASITYYPSPEEKLNITTDLSKNGLEGWKVVRPETYKGAYTLAQGGVEGKIPAEDVRIEVERVANIFEVIDIK